MKTKNKDKKKTRRSRVKYPGLDPRYQPKVRRECIDHDYVNKLSAEEKQWLSNFNEEWLGGNFYHKGELIHKELEEKRDCYRRNSRRNRDASSVAMATGRLYNIDDLYESIEGSQSEENAFEELMNNLIDLDIKENGWKS